MSDTESYLQLGTSNSRKETEKDHRNLDRLMKEKWSDILNFPRKTSGEIADVQLRTIRNLVKHAFETVPLYRTKYENAGFEPNDLRTWEDFQALPILTKEELIAGFPKENISTQHTTEFTTRSSGSSGQFVTIAVSPQAVYIDTIQGARQLIMQSNGKHGPNDLALFIYTSPWWVSSINGSFPQSFLPTTTKPEEAIQNILRKRPKLLSTYPTYLQLFHEADVRLGSLGIESIIVHSEQSTQAQRDEFAEFFGVPVLDEFSSEELTRIALQCPELNYHLEEDACFIEIVDLNTKKPVPDGIDGLVVGTNLINYATPIIRYSQGDLGAISQNQNCKCESNFRILESPKGRAMDSIKLDDGSFVPASCFMDLAYNWYLDLDVPVHGMKYRFIQTKTSEIEIHVQPERFQLTSSQKQRIIESVYSLVPRSMQVGIREVTQMINDPTTKYRPVVSEVRR